MANSVHPDQTPRSVAPDLSVHYLLMLVCTNTYKNTVLLLYVCLAYTERYKDKPKFIISAGGDECFMIDDSRFYYDQLQGGKYLRYSLQQQYGVCLR